MAIAQEMPGRLDDGAPPEEIRRPFFRGSGGGLFNIWIRNVLLTTVTLGGYYFWAKVRTRTYMYSQTEFAEDRFGYHGTPREMLSGWLKAMLLFAGPAFALGIVGAVFKSPLVGALINLALYLYILAITPIAMVGSRRYRMSRTSWRGIRFAFRGHVKEYVNIFILGSLRTALTLGLYAPYFWHNRQKFFVGNTWFGTTRFEYDGNGKDIYNEYLKAILLSIVTLGFYWFWFSAWRQRYYWSHVTFGGARFRSTVTGGNNLKLSFTCLLMLVCSLGWAWPWIRVKIINYQCDNLALVGMLDLTAIHQAAQTATATGDALADMTEGHSLLDMDFGGS